MECDIDYDNEYNDYMMELEDEENLISENVVNQTNNSLFARKESIDIIKEEKIKQFNEEEISELCEIFGVTEGNAIYILDQNKWNFEKAKYFLQDKYVFQKKNEKSVDDYLCLICYNDCNNDNSYSLSCNHRFCNDCFEGYVSSCISEGPSCVFKNCPFMGCEERLDKKTFQKFGNEAQQKKYEKYLLDTMVVNSEKFKWCPGLNCNSAIVLKKAKKSEYKKIMNIKCEGCKTCFCYLCLKDAHRPLKCDLYITWQSFVLGKKGNLNELWIQIHTKNCPNCKIAIEKNQGCMHMTCKHCKHEFCWICKGDWKDHGEKTGGFYKCNIYKENKDDMKKLSSKEKELKKFDFYNERFSQHLKSKNHAETKKVEVIEKMNDLFLSVNEYKEDLEYLDKALELIIECRRCIAYSYPSGFFLTNELKKEFFDFLQLDLIYSVECFDKLTDAYQEPNNFIDETQLCLNSKYFDLKENVKNLTITVANYFNKIAFQLENDIPDIKDELDIKLNKKQTSIFIEDDQVWICRSCTYANTIGTNKCVICDSENVA